MAENRQYRDWQSGDDDRRQDDDRYGYGADENNRQGNRGSGRGRDQRWGSSYGSSAYGGDVSGGNRGRNQTMGQGWQDDQGGGSYGYGYGGSQGGGQTGSQGSEGYGSQRGYGGQHGGYGYGSGGYANQDRTWGDASWGGGQDRNQGQRSGSGQQRGMLDRATDEVSSWFGDRGAEHRREMDQHRGRGPKNYKRSDERIREDVCDRLSDDGMVDASEIDVKVSGTEVTLDGAVGSRDQRRQAEDCVERVSGVTHVQNNLRVKSTSTQGSGSQTGSQQAGTNQSGYQAGQSSQWGQGSSSTGSTSTSGTTSSQQYKS